MLEIDLDALPVIPAVASVAAQLDVLPGVLAAPVGLLQWWLIGKGIDAFMASRSGQFCILGKAPSAILKKTDLPGEWF